MLESTNLGGSEGLHDDKQAKVKSRQDGAFSVRRAADLVTTYCPVLDGVAFSLRE